VSVVVPCLCVIRNLRMMIAFRRCDLVFNSQDDDITTMCLLGSQDDSLMMCLLNSQDDDGERVKGGA